MGLRASGKGGGVGVDGDRDKMMTDVMTQIPSFSSFPSTQLVIGRKSCCKLPTYLYPGRREMDGWR